MTESNNNNEEKNSLVVPISIIVAGVLVAVTIFFTSSRVKTDSRGQQAGLNPQGAESTITIKPVSADDHVLGDPNAPVKIVEYSDFECPFCKSFHMTMGAVMQSDYGKSGKVAWVYRHFPLTSLHPKAPREAEASECANELGGNLKFWEFANKIFEVTPSNNGLDPVILPQIAEAIGLNRRAFEVCLDSGRYKGEVERSVEEALDAGGTGTPWSVVVAKNGKTFLINGAQKYETVKSILEEALEEK